MASELAQTCPSDDETSATFLEILSYLAIIFKHSKIYRGSTSSAPSIYFRMLKKWQETKFILFLLAARKNKRVCFLLAPQCRFQERTEKHCIEYPYNKKGRGIIPRPSYLVMLISNRSCRLHNHRRRNHRLRSRNRSHRPEQPSFPASSRHL